MTAPLAPTTTPPAVDSSAPAATAAPGSYYDIQRGDTLEGIARRHGVSLAALKAANNLETDIIYFGTKLLIPEPGFVVPTATPSAATPTPMAHPLVQGIPLPPRIVLSPMSFDYQTWDNCGPVSTLMALSFYGITISQPEAAAALKTYPQDKSVLPQEIVSYLDSLGIEGRVLFNGSLDVVRRLLAQGIPVILRHRANLQEDYGHYTVAKGYDERQGVLIVNDSYSGPNRSVPYIELEQLWEQFNRLYIPVYRRQDRPVVEAILGPDANQLVMLDRALVANRARANQDPRSAVAWLNLGEVHFLLGDNAAAVAAWEKAQGFSPPKRMLWYVSWPATAYNALGMPGKVIALTQPVIAQQPALPELLLEQGLAYAALGDRVNAQQALRQALTYAPRLEGARRALEKLGPG